MIDYYIISNASRAANYGIGTYSGQIVSCLAKDSDININYIEMFANTSEYLKDVDEKGNTHYKIPIVSGNVEGEISCRNAFYYLSEHIKRHANTIHVFHFNYFQHYYLAVLLKIAFPECRIILTVHYLSWCFDLKGNETLFRYYISPSNNIPDDDGTNRLIKNVRSNFELERNFMSLADEVIVLSRATKNIIKNDYHIQKDKLLLVYNGLDISDVSGSMPQGIDSFKDSERKYLLYVGRLDEIKGVSYLVKAFNKLSQEDARLHLIIVGDGDFASCLNATNGNWERITFTGKISKEYLEQIYPKITLGILPSFHEQCSYAAIEMMAHGIPMVITDSTGLKEMLEEYPPCIVSINQENFSEEEFVDALYSAIHTLVSDEARLQEVSSLVKRLYQEKYTQSLMSAGYLSLLKAKDYPIFSKDLLYMIDRRMIALIDSCPDIDTSFFGMTGIGCYLWYRICTLKDSDNKQDISHSLLLQEYMIYWMDWIYKTILQETDIPSELVDVLYKIKDTDFYKTKTSELIKLVPSLNSEKAISEEHILSNALRIFNCKI